MLEKRLRRRTPSGLDRSRDRRPGAPASQTPRCSGSGGQKAPPPRLPSEPPPRSPAPTGVRAAWLSWLLAAPRDWSGTPGSLVSLAVGIPSAKVTVLSPSVPTCC